MAEKDTILKKSMKSVDSLPELEALVYGITVKLMVSSDTYFLNVIDGF